MIRPFCGVHPQVPASAFVDVSAQIIGDVILGERASVWMNAVLRGDVHHIRIGAESNVQDGAVLHGMKGRYPVVIGDRCTIGHNATVHGCVLDDEVLVGMGAVVLNGAHIGTGWIVAAGAVIPEGNDLPPRTLVAGVPGKVRRELARKIWRAYAPTPATMSSTPGHILRALWMAKRTESRPVEVEKAALLRLLGFLGGGGGLVLMLHGVSPLLLGLGLGFAGLG